MGEKEAGLAQCCSLQPLDRVLILPLWFLRGEPRGVANCPVGTVAAGGRNRTPPELFVQEGVFYSCRAPGRDK